jgi:hypothetical protein
MQMAQTRIMGIMISDRMTEVKPLQDILTEFGCLIKTRLGLHETNDKTCSRKGLLILELTGDNVEWSKFETKVKSISGVECKFMDFNL